jgi:endoglucanase
MKKLIAFATLLFCHIFLVNIAAQSLLPKYGITLCGAEFGEHNLPGKINEDYTYPTTTDIDYFVSKGVDLIQLPIKWERVQRNLGDQLDEVEVGYIKNFIDDCSLRKINVTIVLQNFGRYNKNCVEYVVGESEVTAWHLRDFWMKMTQALSNQKNIYAFSLMAEPTNMNSTIWLNTLQCVIDGIRTLNKNIVLLIEGNNYSNASTWLRYNDELKCLQDPSNNLLFNAHCYFDNDFSGRYKKAFIEDGANEFTGVERVKPFVQWLKLNNLNGYIGEFGVPKNDENWFAVMNNFLDYIHSNNIGGCYWAAGQWWKNYPLSIQPENYNDQPQLKLFSKYFNKNKDLANPIATQIWTRVFNQNNYKNLRLSKA